jgi:hypothetical protein
MEDNAAKAKNYRARAKQVRIITEDVRGDDSRETLLAVANDYDELAAALSKPVGRAKS